MNGKLLEVKNLVVEIEDKEVVKGVSIEIEKGEVVVLTGQNGSGKSTLAQMLMGNPKYQIPNPKQIQNSKKQNIKQRSEVMFEGKNLLEMSIDERSRAGLYLAYQNPAEVPGVKVFTMCKVMYEAHGNKIERVVEFRKKLEELAERVGLTKEHVVRDVNTGFSGGEKKRLELLQLLLLDPKLVILDEIDSGLDKKGRKMVIEVVREMQKKGTAFLIITHYDEWVKNLEVTRTLVMSDGQLQTK